MEAYTDEEYTAAWSASLAVEVVGFCLNIFMVITWQLFDKADRVNMELRICVWAGVLYGVVNTFPVLFLKVCCVLFRFRFGPWFLDPAHLTPALPQYDLPCSGDCVTEEWCEFSLFSGACFTLLILSPPFSALVTLGCVLSTVAAFTFCWYVPHFSCI